MATKTVRLSVRLSGVAAATLLCLAASGCQKQRGAETPPPATGAPAPQTLTIWWAQWAPADGLQALAEEFGRKENVTVKVHQIPWSSFQDQVFQEFGKPATAFDIVVGDSQWLGRGATKGLYVDLTGWLPSAVDLKTLLFGPSSDAEGVVNLFGALRRAMAKTGYSDLKEFQRVGLTVRR